MSYTKLPYLAAWREYAHLSRRDLEIKTGRSMGSLRRMEKGISGASWGTIVVLAHACGTTPHVLIGEPPPPRAEKPLGEREIGILQEIEDHLFARLLLRLRAELLVQNAISNRNGNGGEQRHGQEQQDHEYE
jgi:transcriptional regulator with XRE-family HTH domain